MALEWMKLRTALKDYVEELENTKIASKPWADSGWSWPKDRTNLRKDPSRFGQGATSFEEIEWFHTREFGDWYLDRYWEFCESAPELPAEDSIHLGANMPDYVLDALIGWIYYGQAIASKSFIIYVKVFALLSLAAKYSDVLFQSILF